MEMKLRADMKRAILTGDIHIEGQLYVDDSHNLNTGWRVKTWSNSNDPLAYLPADLHWFINKTRKVVKWAYGYFPDFHPPLESGDDPMIEPSRKAFILATVEKWNKARYD